MGSRSGSDIQNPKACLTCWRLRCSSFFPTSLCGVLVFGCALSPSSSRPPPALAHTQLVLTQLVTTRLAHHTTYSHTTCHQTYSHTHNLSTHNLSSHNLSPHNCSPHNLSPNLLTHTTCPHTTCPRTTCHHTTCSHTTSSPHNLLTHNLSPNLLTHNLSTHNLSSHNLSPHNLLTHTQLVTTWRHLPSLCVAGVALGDIDRHFAWQAWHLATWTCTLRGRRGTWRHRSSLCVAGVALVALGWLWWRAWVPVDAVDAVALCVAGVALGEWHLATWIVTLRGRRGTYGAGMALVARLVPVWRRGRRRCLRGRRGTWRHRPSLCVAGVALGDIDRHFAWQAWHLWHWAGLVAPLVPVWRRGRRRCLRGRGGTWRRRPSLCVAGVALGDINRHFASQAWHLPTDRHFAWQAWHLWHWTGSGGRLVPVWRRGRPRCLHGRRGTWRHRPSLCVAGVALGDIDRHFAWQSWHLWHWTGSGDLRGRRGTWRHWPSLCVAGVALGDIDCHFAWQAWHLWHWAGFGGAPGSHLAPWAPPLFAWQAWDLATLTVTLRGRRSTWRHRSSLCVAGVALMALDWVWWRAQLFHTHLSHT